MLEHTPGNTEEANSLLYYLNLLWMFYVRSMLTAFKDAGNRKVFIENICNEYASKSRRENEPIYSPYHAATLYFPQDRIIMQTTARSDLHEKSFNGHYCNHFSPMQVSQIQTLLLFITQALAQDKCRGKKHDCVE